MQSFRAGWKKEKCAFRPQMILNSFSAKSCKIHFFSSLFSFPNFLPLLHRNKAENFFTNCLSSRVSKFLSLLTLTFLKDPNIWNKICTYRKLCWFVPQVLYNDICNDFLNNFLKWGSWAYNTLDHPFHLYKNIDYLQILLIIAVMIN